MKRLSVLPAAALAAAVLSSCIPLSSKQIVNSTGAEIAVHTTYHPSVKYTIADGGSVTVSEPNWSSVYADTLPSGTKVASKSEYSSNGKTEVTTFYALTDTWTYTVANTSKHDIYVVEMRFGISDSSDKNKSVAVKIAQGGEEAVTVYTGSPQFKAYYLSDPDDESSSKTWTSQFSYARAD